MELQEPKLPEFYSPGRVFLSAFAAGAAINARKTQLEAQLQHLQLQSEAQQIREQQNEQLFKIREEGMQNQAQHWQNMLTLGQERVNSQYDKVGKIIPQLSAYQRDLANIDAPPGTQAWVNQANLIKSKPEYNVIAGTTEAQRVWQQAYSEHKDSSKAIRQNQNDLMANYYTNLTKNQWSDYMFENPNAWDTNSKGDKVLKVKKGVIQPPTAKQNEYDNAVTIPAKDWQTYVDTHNQIKGILTDRSKQAASPSAVISPAAPVSQKLDRARQAVNDPEATPEEKARAQQILNAAQ